MKRILALLLTLCSLLTVAVAEEAALPIYHAMKRNFVETVRPEWINPNPVVDENRNDRGDYIVYTYADEARLEVSPEVLFYREYSGTMETIDGTETLPCQATSGQMVSLAPYLPPMGSSDAETPPTLEKTVLTGIALNDAKGKLEALLTMLNLTGYSCAYALDMSVERVMALGKERDARVEAGEEYSNVPLWNDTQMTADDEGFFLQYKCALNGTALEPTGFAVNALVTRRGVVSLTVRDAYAVGTVYETPEQLLTAQAMLDLLIKDGGDSEKYNAAAGNAKLELYYYPMRASNKKDGMVFSPMWLVTYGFADGGEARDAWAVYSAVDGRRIADSF
ncbi:MAG: hypothetical protein RR521_12530 [Clostridia bacterium]